MLYIPMGDDISRDHVCPASDESITKPSACAVWVFPAPPTIITCVLSRNFKSRTLSSDPFTVWKGALTGAHVTPLSDVRKSVPLFPPTTPVPPLPPSTCPKLIRYKSWLVPLVSDCQVLPLSWVLSKVPPAPHA